ncbi:tRNA pseudouridine(55) synthase TruB [Mesonia aestuariivivens]|uniref:tRNA pseudouridine synthase B n=1 Tax=Mesonia aestuariivivens TaxID=2796128 RepID=A0ABS6VXZ0_9FLAO|nr:tRNA pseudouridine(55) synthase TruB [Mesonia aestuariivivens]MBW2960459.1 tRNA pseudouridine(55) synthase TruB [Mesonia aestuariivivens]
MTSFTAEDFKNGQILLFDKPLEWTSFQVVNKVRWLIRKNCGIKKIKVGHAGTLDPLATGLLVICTGKFTKRIEEFQGQEKEYTGTFTLGATTPSYDLETEIDATFATDHLSEEKLVQATTQFTGAIEQLPPIFSALKKDGKRLYEYARKGEEVKINARTVTISSFELTKIDLPKVDFRVSCSKGTYIRSLAHDFGRAVESGAHLSVLRRTKIGDFKVENAYTIDEFIETLPKPEKLT